MFKKTVVMPLKIQNLENKVAELTGKVDGIIESLVTTNSNLCKLVDALNGGVQKPSVSGPSSEPKYIS